MADIFNVLDTFSEQKTVFATSHGVKADSSTDDTAALQAAIDATPANGTLVLPAGFMAYTTLSVTKAIHIHGQGYGSTFLKQTANGDGLKINVGESSPIYNVEVSDLSFGASAARSSGAALRVGYVGFFNGRNIRIADNLGGAPYEGLRIDRASDSHFSNFRVAGCVSHGAVIQPGSSTSVIVEIHFDTECEFRNCGGDGMYLLLDQAYSEGVCSLEGIHIAGHAYNNTKAGVRVHATVAGASIRNLHLAASYDSNQGTSTTPGSYDAGLVLDASFDASAEIRRVNICMGDGWSSNNASSGVAILQRVKDVRFCCGEVRQNVRHGIDIQNVDHVHIGSGVKVTENSQTADDTSYGISIGGASQFVTVAAFIDNYDLSKDQKGIQLGGSVVDIDLSGVTFGQPDVGTTAKINGGNGAANARIKLPPGGQVVAKTTTYQVDADLNSPDRVVTCDTTGGAFTVTLPRAANYPGRIITVKRTAGGNNVTIAATAGSVETTTCNTTPVTHVSNGTNWVDIS